MPDERCPLSGGRPVGSPLLPGPDLLPHLASLDLWKAEGYSLTLPITPFSHLFPSLIWVHGPS